MALGPVAARGKAAFEEDVGLVPVDVVVDEDGVGVGVEGDVLDELGGLPGAGDADGVAERPFAEDSDAVDVGDGRHVVEGAGIDVPGVVLLGCVLEGLELVAAGVRGEGFGSLRWTETRLVMQPVFLSMVSLR